MGILWVGLTSTQSMTFVFVVWIVWQKLWFGIAVRDNRIETVDLKEEATALEFRGWTLVDVFLSCEIHQLD